MRDHMKKRLAELHVDMDPKTSQRHIAEIGLEVTSPSAAALPRRVRSIRRMGLAIAAATILLIPVAAFAADNAVPGEFLYPVKRTTEQVHSFFDSDVQARHRVEEIEVLLERDADPTFVMERVRVAEQHFDDEETALMERFTVARERAEVRVQTEASETTDPERTQESRDETPSGGSGEGGSTTIPPDTSGNGTQQGSTTSSSSPSGDGTKSPGPGEGEGSVTSTSKPPSGSGG